jgi:hypothetical protein
MASESFLAAQRVLYLWDYHKVEPIVPLSNQANSLICQWVTHLMTLTFLGFYASSVVTTIYGFIQMKRVFSPSRAYSDPYTFAAGIMWDPMVNMCMVTQVDPALIASAAAPLLFELIMFAAVIWNAIDRPRQAHTSLKSSLANDGLIFFAVGWLSSVPSTNMLMSLTRPQSTFAQCKWGSSQAEGRR